MAEADKNMAEEPVGERRSSATPDFTKAESEKHSQYDSNSTLSPHERIGPDDEITWHYLTFETKLPRPAYLIQSPNTSDTKSQPPECPNLKKYTSPFDWSKTRKRFMTWFGCIATTITAYTAGSYATGIPQMMEEWHISEPAAEVGIAMFTAGFAIAPMFLAPFR